MRQITGKTDTSTTTIAYFFLIQVVHVDHGLSSHHAVTHVGMVNNEGQGNAQAVTVQIMLKLYHVLETQDVIVGCSNRYGIFFLSKGSNILLVN